MNYFIYEISVGNKTSMNKARQDANNILSSVGYEELKIPISHHKGIRRFLRQFQIVKEWKHAFSVLKPNDRLLIQYPPIENSFLLGVYVRQLSRKGIKIALLIHDVMLLRNISIYKKILYSLEEPLIFKTVDSLIVHNTFMKVKLEKKFKHTKMIPLQIFDYLVTDSPAFRQDVNGKSKELPIIIAGNLTPCYGGRYLEELPAGLEFNLYGVGFEDKQRENIHYKGIFNPDDLPGNLQGSFGLVWYGDSSRDCIGDIREYLKIINPHRASLYLAAGIPLITWKGAALAAFILENKCGFVVNSLYEIKDHINCLSEEEYHAMQNNAEEMGNRLRGGSFLQAAISQCDL